MHRFKLLTFVNAGYISVLTKVFKGTFANARVVRHFTEPTENKQTDKKNMTRKILSIIVGYAIFVVTSLLFFKIMGQKPHSDPTTSFVILTTIFGAIFSFVAGLVAKLIAKTSSLKINYILAFIIAGFRRCRSSPQSPPSSGLMTNDEFSSDIIHLSIFMN